MQHFQISSDCDDDVLSTNLGGRRGLVGLGRVAAVPGGVSGGGQVILDVAGASQ